MDFIDIVKKPVISEMQVFEETFVSTLQTENALLVKVNESVLRKKGKQLRPTLVLLAAKLCGGVNFLTIQSAISIELLHTASLIHDDVVDETLERRGKASVNAQWNNKIAVLSGDYMLSKSLLHATKTQNIGILDIISNIGVQLSEGELLQLSNIQKSETSEEDYFTMIRQKTALLFASCTRIGAMSVGAGEDSLLRLWRYGEYLGICFQIKDDIFDYSDNNKIGKPTKNDIREGKITLPLIYALRNTNGAAKEQVVDWIREKNFSPDNVQAIANFAYRHGGIDYATKRMKEFKEKAIAEIAIFPDSDVKQALIDCAEFAVSRTV
ncbi:MAG: polyprenyl synthetase family protein [Prevotellaceae bacterium]|jgi:octaprenyl-diphosphate synthase|nr:polyprenyl synthetase family protein [Prevotellaceae bacterium]